MAQNHYNVLDNGVQPWLPGGHARINSHHHDHRRAKEQSGFEAQYGIKSETNSPPPVMFEGQTRAGQRGQRVRNQSNWAKSGPGMQAIFLGPNKNSCGTGVFIPRGQGINLQFTNKPAFSPVLLPSRVIQALNLNVHELGQHIKPQSAPVVVVVPELISVRELPILMVPYQEDKLVHHIKDEDESTESTITRANERREPAFGSSNATGGYPTFSISTININDLETQESETPEVEMPMPHPSGQAQQFTYQLFGMDRKMPHISEEVSKRKVTSDIFLIHFKRIIVPKKNEHDKQMYIAK
ncbi:hypothetical protein C2S51_011162 [Perilla frutescens var. frutescens]|nr:hypothetical protein C2S51_011162 [Perilla frutescens var. frutescens]